MITGYNITNFDLPYLLNRADALKLQQFPYLGRVKGSRSTMRDTTFSSKAYGTRESKAISTWASGRRQVGRQDPALTAGGGCAGAPRIARKTSMAVSSLMSCRSCSVTTSCGPTL